MRIRVGLRLKVRLRDMFLRCMYKIPVLRRSSAESRGTYN